MRNPRITLEQRLIAASQGHASNDAFIRATMRKVRRTSATKAFNKALASTEATNASWIQRIKHLPRIATGIGLGAVILTAGTAYAAYNLWLSPTAKVHSVVQQYGRDQALIELKNCEQPNQKTDVEITNNSGGTASGAAKALAAQCELEAVQSWAMQRFHGQPSQVLFAMTITHTAGNSLSLKAAETGQLHTYTITKDTPFVFQGNIIPQSTLKTGDTIALVMGTGIVPDAVVKLSFSPSYYLGDAVANTYHQRQSCIGNTDASCIELPMLDVLRSGEGGANPSTRGDTYEIQGKLTALTPTMFTLQATSGKTYTVHTDTDVIGTFNTSNPYGSVNIALGDILEVMYSVPAGNKSQDIQSTQYHQIELLLQGFDKQARSTTNQQKYHY